MQAYSDKVVERSSMCRQEPFCAFNSILCCYVWDVCHWNPVNAIIVGIV